MRCAEFYNNKDDEEVIIDMSSIIKKRENDEQLKQLKQQIEQKESEQKQQLEQQDKKIDGVSKDVNDIKSKLDKLTVNFGHLNKEFKIVVAAFVAVLAYIVADNKTNFKDFSQKIDNINYIAVQNQTNIQNIMGSKIALVDLGIDMNKINMGVYIEKYRNNEYLYAQTQTISLSSEMTKNMGEVSIKTNDINISTSSLATDVCVGTDSEGNVYIAEELIDKTVLLTYVDGDKEVYFLGQYNENYRWNGYCVTNAYYMDGTLYGICESNFENGQRLDYKSFYKDASNEWIYTNRVCTDEGNLGTSISYAFEYNKVKNFTNTNVRVTDIFYVDKFIETFNPTMSEYYYGNTSGGEYNDDSGQAYYVRYFEDGTVKTLYQGKFIGGEFYDDTGEAWYIVKEVDTEYMYYKGVFENCAPKKIGDYVFENPIDLTRINEIIQDKSFECGLKWATE